MVNSEPARIPKVKTPTYSDQEIKLLSMISHGKPYKTVATDLGLTKHQVNLRLERLRWDMEAENTIHLIALAIRKGII